MVVFVVVVMMTDEVEKFQQVGLSRIEATGNLKIGLHFSVRTQIAIRIDLLSTRERCSRMPSIKNPDNITTICSRDEVETHGECVMATSVCVVCLCVR